MMEELLKAILGGADAPAAQQSGQDPLADLIGAVLGGGAGQPAPQQPQQLPSNDPLSELIKGVLGGEPQAAQPASGGGGGIIDILGSILGGGRPGGQNNSFLQPIANALAEKLGISPQIALIVINLAITLLLSRSREQTGTAPGDSRRGGTGSQQEGFDLDGLLDENYLQATGATTQLARQTGMNQDQATRSLQEALMLLNQQTQTMSGRAAPKKAGGLDHLLDTWED